MSVTHVCSSTGQLKEAAAVILFSFPRSVVFVYFIGFDCKGLDPTSSPMHIINSKFHMRQGCQLKSRILSIIDFPAQRLTPSFCLLNYKRVHQAMDVGQGYRNKNITDIETMS